MDFLAHFRSGPRLIALSWSWKLHDPAAAGPVGTSVAMVLRGHFHPRPERMATSLDRVLAQLSFEQRVSAIAQVARALEARHARGEVFSWPLTNEDGRMGSANTLVTMEPFEVRLANPDVSHPTEPEGEELVATRSADVYGFGNLCYEITDGAAIDGEGPTHGMSSVLEYPLTMGLFEKDELKGLPIAPPCNATSEVLVASGRAPHHGRGGGTATRWQVQHLPQGIA